jgi:glycosyltransferase involved in cell wall biosynthesis
MAQRLKVLLLIPHLGGGGAEQVIALLARSLPREKYEVHLGLVTQASAAFENIPPWVEIRALGARRVRSAALSLLRLIRKLQPDVVLSGMAHLNFLLLLLRPLLPRKTALLIRQNGTVSSALAHGGLPAYTRLAYWLLYRRADRVICQTPAMAADLARATGTPVHLMEVLPNPVDVEGIRAAVLQSPNSTSTNLWSGAGPHLLAVGRLEQVKGFDLLLQALAQVRKRFPGADLTVVGAGTEESALRARSLELGLGSSAHFTGQVTSPSGYFPGATLFVLSSRHEGLPNALLEAAAGGLPIVATPASQGLVELLRGQPGVWLAPEVSAEALARSLVTALETLWPGERFVHLFVEQFSLKYSIDAYQRLIDTAARERRP